MRQQGLTDLGRVSKFEEIRAANRNWSNAPAPGDIADIDSGVAEIARILHKAGVPPTPLFEGEEAPRPSESSPNNNVVVRIRRSDFHAGWIMFHGPYFVTVDGTLLRRAFTAYWRPKQPRSVHRVLEADGVTRKSGPNCLDVVFAERWHHGLSFTHATSSSGPSVGTLDELIDERIAGRMSLATWRHEPEVGIGYTIIKDVLKEGLSRALASSSSPT